MIFYNQKEFFKMGESGKKELIVGVQASLLKINCVGGGSCHVYAKLFKDSPEFPLAGIDNSSYAPVKVFNNGSYSCEIAGYYSIFIESDGALEIQVKTVY